MVRKIHKVLKMWSVKNINRLSKLQKKLIVVAFQLLKPGGLLVYSTCTLAPEENEDVVEELLQQPNARVEPLEIEGVKHRSGLYSWHDKLYTDQMRNVRRIYPQDHGTNGFFIAKIRKLSV